MFTPESLASFEREVGATLTEFERSLEKAAPGAVTVLGAGVFQVDCDNVTLRMDAKPVAPRRIGLFVLPVLKVSYQFSGGDEKARKALLDHLDRAMQRGGG
ncbi:hypothetical protein [Nitrogeniibacter aestuarii]|uniref:hypothetical protein n=1 Tax=Nitrogeniibacter aestuarii TaxID=2815343 RepID=UPI001D12DC22|nr:hypothetical protein [Nitrogeniibacter aestuarii]